MNKSDRIYVAGHNGLVGSAFVRRLVESGYDNLLLRSHQELDLANQALVRFFFERQRPDVVIDAAALVGGISANAKNMAEFFYVNDVIQTNLIWTAYRYGVKQFLFLGSACMYPKDCQQPMKETDLLSGLPEPTNEGYALAKIGGSRLCTYLNRQYGVSYISAIPANAYGIGDSFDLENSHVIPALIRKYHEAKVKEEKEVVLWGTGKPLREFIYTDDLADAGIFLLNHYRDSSPINVGTGEEVSILELSEIVKATVGYTGKIVTDSSKPDGMMRRLCDSSRIRSLGWTSKIGLRTGIGNLYEWFLENEVRIRK